MGDVTEIQVVECRVGHTWTRKKQRGRPKVSDEHRRFFVIPLTTRVRPPERVRQEWAEQELVLDDPGYEKRWEEFWAKTARLLAAKGLSWAAVDVEKLDIYVRSMRLAELHRLMAQDEPYHRTDRGGLRPHPGWELAERETRRADALAIELGLKPDPKKRTDTVEDRYKTMLQTSAEGQGELHAAVGPEGQPL
jgi:hypothetical protein